MKTSFKKIAFYYRSDVPHAREWESKLSRWIKTRYPKVVILPSSVVPKSRRAAPQLLIVLGGDGTICEAAQRLQRWNTLILGLNLGHVGFLASVRDKDNFTKGLTDIFEKRFRTIPRMLIKASVLRRGKTIFSGYALNDFAVQHLLGLVNIRVAVDGHKVQYIHGTGVLVATATGSTAYNLSAHGPVVMPDIKCFVITELLDHNIPTPSLIIKRNRTITLTIDGFRKKNQFLIRKTGEPADVVLASDVDRVMALTKGDVITIRRSERLVRFIELEKNYFFRSLQEKFAFR